MSSLLEFERVSFGYGRTLVLDDVSLSVSAGEFVAVVGPNGAGKTTLLKLGLGLLRPTRGAVRLFGVPLEQFRDWPMIGYVPQRATASSAVPISVEEVVRSGLAGALGLLRRPDREQRRRVDEVLELLEIGDVRRRPVTRLSGGQQQRALIARALVTKPRLLVLDEPTTGVDQRTRAALRATFTHLVRDEGAGVVTISHDPDAFAGIADRVVEVRNRRTVVAAAREVRAP